MRLTLQIVSILLMSISINACQKIEGPAGDVFKTWEVKDFVSIENSSYARDENSPIYISINDDQTYNLQLEQNTCQGEILGITELTIIMEQPGCTKMCCESSFSRRFEELIPSISMYKVTGTTLRLYIKNWGFIECELSQ